MATRSDGSQATSRAILVIAGILVLSALAYFAIKYFSAKAEIVENEQQIDDLSTEVKELEDNILQFQEQINSLEVDLATKEQLLQQKVDELVKVQSQLADARRSSKTQTAEFRKLELRLQELQSVLEEYDDLIVTLRSENQALAGQVEELTARESQLQTRTQELEQVNTQTREQLDRTVAVASTLKARSLKFFSVKSGKKEKEFTKMARWRMKDLQICYTMLENRIAPPGDRTVYAVIEDANGTPITNFSSDISGRFPYQNQDKVYSTSKTVSFFGTEMEDCMDFSLPEDTKYEKGIYYVFLFADNNPIGQGSFEID